MASDRSAADIFTSQLEHDTLAAEANLQLAAGLPARSKLCVRAGLPVQRPVDAEAAGLLLAGSSVTTTGV